MNRIFLVGFMCSGKSSVGKALARKLGWIFLDVDEEIQKQEKMTIPEIFQKRGEPYFRRLELEVLKDLSNKEKVVIATGGGLGSNPRAMDIMKEKGLVVWLDVAFDTFLKRCGKDPNRPLLKKSKEDLKNLLIERSKVYSLAHLRVEASKEVDAIVEEVLSFLKSKVKIPDTP